MGRHLGGLWATGRKRHAYTSLDVGPLVNQYGEDRLPRSGGVG